MDIKRLSENHKNALYASVYQTLKNVNEIEFLLSHPNNNPLQNIVIDLEPSEVLRLQRQIAEIKTFVCYLIQKYELKSKPLPISQYINSRKTKIWETLCDIKSYKLKKYGSFPTEISNEFDHDIEQLLSLTEKL